MKLPPAPPLREMNPDGTVKNWFRNGLMHHGYGHIRTTEALDVTPQKIMPRYPPASKMRKVAMATDTAIDDFDMFLTEYGWELFLKPGKTLGSGYIDHPVLPKQPS